MKYIYKARCGGTLFGSQHLEARGRIIRDFKANLGQVSLRNYVRSCPQKTKQNNKKYPTMYFILSFPYNPVMLPDEWPLFT